MEEKTLHEIVAYHEAGHAVMAIQHGRQIQEIAINSPWDGHVLGSNKRFCRSYSASENNPGCRLYRLTEIIADVKILLAGPAAECEYRNLHLQGRDSPFFTDHEVINEILCTPSINKLFEQHVSRGLDGLASEVGVWLRQQGVWDTIRLVAEDLMCRRSMDWDELMDLLLLKDAKLQLRLF